jgi:hypothetical protein
MQYFSKTFGVNENEIFMQILTLKIILFQIQLGKVFQNITKLFSHSSFY